MTGSTPGLPTVDESRAPRPDVAAVIPVLRPLDDLLRTARALSGQVSTVVVVDDGSPCTSDVVLRTCARLPRVRVVRHPTNRGIAAALNTGLSSLGVWRDAPLRAVLTVDQDSVLAPHHVDDLISACREAERAGAAVGAVAPGRVRVGQAWMTYRSRSLAPGVATVDEALQSGALWMVDALRLVGGFQEDLVIDGVDTEMCLRLQEAGRVIVVADDLEMVHTLGRAETVRLLGRDVVSTRHRPFRRYYMARNRLRLLPRHSHVSPTGAAVAVRRVLVNAGLGLARDGRPGADLSAGLAGVWDAARGRSGKLSPARRDRWA